MKENEDQRRALASMREHMKSIGHEAKMQLLVDNYDVLVKADTQRKSNRTGKQEICRMKGSKTQSYFILDAPEYKTGR